LQAADHVQAGIRMARADRRPFAGRFLDAILAEMALPGGRQRLDCLGGAALGDGDQGDVIRLSPRDLAGGGNRLANLC
jgi:hypothetical protein